MKKVKFKTTFYYFLIMLFLLNTRAIKYNNPHIFSLMIVIPSILIILMIRLRVSEEDDFKFRHLILGIVCAYGVYYSEKIIMN
ncbi:hypothetical protein ASG99_14035 [Bacillus sp. Soil768D1]|nr:hypothetical protein ASG99_14035 [Bacillus sp. Soil768D1]